MRLQLRPLNNTTKPTDPIATPHSAPYNLITVPGGFTDMWLKWLPANQGWTSGINERVNEPAPGSWTHRIDMIFARPGPRQQLDVAGEVTGDEPAAKDPHTGSVALRPRRRGADGDAQAVAWTWTTTAEITGLYLYVYVVAVAVVGSPPSSLATARAR